MEVALFAGICVRNYEAARPWYERLLGSEPTLIAHETEAVWDIAEHRSVYIVEDAEHAGHARLLLFTEDLDSVVAEIAARGIDFDRRETYANGVRKVTYRDADGNEIGFGGAPEG